MEANGPLDLSLRYCMDYDYWFRLGLNGARFAYVPRLLAATRLHDDAATLAQRVACHVATNDITRRHLGRTPDRWLFNYAHAVIDKRGLQRGQPATTLVLAVLSVYAALRWNRAISRSMLVTLKRWVMTDTVAPLWRRCAARAAPGRSSPTERRRGARVAFSPRPRGGCARCSARVGLRPSD